MAAPSEMRRSASPRFVAPHTKGTVKGHLSMWYASSAGVSTSDSSMKSTPERLQHLRLGEVPDAGLGHDRDRDGLDDPLDQHRVAHAWLRSKKVIRLIYVDCPISARQAIHLHRDGAGHRSADAGRPAAHADRHFPGHQHSR